MITVKEVSNLTGVSVRALHHYDAIGLLHPDEVTETGYRRYGDKAMERLQQILLFRELNFPLKEIKSIMDSPGYDKQKALLQQIELLRLKKEQLDNLIELACSIQEIGVNNMNFTAFDRRKIDEYTRKAKDSWGSTDTYRQFEQKTMHYDRAKWQLAETKLLSRFAEFGRQKNLSADCKAVQKQVDLLRSTITEYYYECTPQILASLGSMYTENESMMETIDQAGGAGTAQFVSKAIEKYCREDILQTKCDV